MYSWIHKGIPLSDWTDDQLIKEVTILLGDRDYQKRTDDERQKLGFPATVEERRHFVSGSVIVFPDP